MKLGRAPSHTAYGNILRFPQRTWEPQDKQSQCHPLPGRLVGVLYPPEEKLNSGIVLPSGGDGIDSGGAAEALRPDVGYVLEVGKKSERDEKEGIIGISDYVSNGDTVLVRPYSGLRFAEYHGHIGFFALGVSDPIFDDVIAVMRGGKWKLLHNWVAINLKEDRNILTPALYKNKVGRVVDAGDNAKGRIGQIAIFGDELYELEDPFDARILFTDNGPYGDDGDVALVREQGHTNIAYVGLKPHTYIHAYAE